MGDKVNLTSKKPGETRAHLFSKKQRNESSRSSSLSPPSSVGQILHLQQTKGNQAVQRLLKSGTIQASLKIGQPNDKYEQEADRVADQVMSMPEQEGSLVNGHLSLVQRQTTCPECPEREEIQTKSIADQITPLVQRQVVPEEEEEPIQTKLIQRQAIEEEEEPVQTKLLQRQETEEEEEPLQAKQASNQTPAVTSNIESSINSLKGGGQPLPESTRSYFEPRFGTDFSQVRVHNDSKASETAKSINAKAFTTGKNVVFGAGQYSPETSEGKRLLTHELTHVVQQRNSTTIQCENNNTPWVEHVILRNRSLFGSASIRVIQRIVGGHVDGEMGPETVHAIARYQRSHGVPGSGEINSQTIPFLYQDAASISQDEEYVNNIRLHLIFDYIGPQPGLLSYYFRPGMTAIIGGVWNLHVDFTPGGLRVLQFGRQAFNSYVHLLQTIRYAMALSAPSATIPGTTPGYLNQSDVSRALDFNRAKHFQSNTISIIQGVVNAVPSGSFSADTVQRIAAWQNNNGLTGDGKIGHLTLRQLFYHLRTDHQYDAMIQLIIDYFNFPGRNVITAYYEPDLAGDDLARAVFIQTMPAIVQVGPEAMIDARFEAVAAAIGHEFEHARLAQARSLLSLSRNERASVQEFMAHSWGLAQARRMLLPVQRVSENIAFAVAEWGGIPRYVRRQPFLVSRHQAAVQGLRIYIARLDLGDVEMLGQPLTDANDIREVRQELLLPGYRDYVNLR